MKRWIFLALLLATLHPGRSLRCYKCNGCETSSPIRESCREVDPDGQRSVCMVQKIRMTGTGDVTTIKKCVTYDKGQPFQCPSYPNSHQMECRSCEGDLCNGGSQLAGVPFLTGVFLFLVHRLLGF